MRPPPKVVRRLLLAPLALALALGLFAASPLLLFTGALADLITSRRWSTLRLVAFVCFYAAFEVIGLWVMLILWIVAGAGRRLHTPGMQEAHYRFMRWWLQGIDRAAESLFALRIRVEDPPEPKTGPVLVFSRHAGPGNSLMLLGMLMIAYGRRPRVVMLAKLQWEPFFDILGNRLPNRFIEHDPTRRDRIVRAIGELADGLGDRDALVLFPEGHDFTARLRLRAIAHLRERGHLEAAEKAERMRRVLPPRYGGVMAAIDAAPDADVVFVAHTVLEDLGSFRALWRQIPLGVPVVARYWRIPAREVPREQEELIRWLFAWWGRIDEWIGKRMAADVGRPDTVAKERPS